MSSRHKSNPSAPAAAVPSAGHPAGALPASVLEINKPADGSRWSRREADDAMSRLLDATLKRERDIAARDELVASANKKFNAGIRAASEEIALLEAQLEQFYTARRKEICAPDTTVARLPNGDLGMERSSQPSLVPLDEKWDWKAIAARLKRTYKSRFFHEPKPPEPDKLKIKKELTAEELEKVGLKLECGERFYINLKRFKEAA